MHDGKLIIIVQIKNESGDVVAVRSGSVVKSQGTGIETVKGGDLLTVYPNPVANDLYIQSDKPIKKIEIYSISGVCVYRCENADQKVDVSGLSNGLYLLIVNTDNGVFSRKIVKRNN